MATLRNQLLNCAANEPILAVVIGRRADLWHEDPVIPNDPVQPKDMHRVLTWEQASPLLEREFDDGYGGVECNRVYAWTATRTLFVACYDGSSWIASVPRNPSDCEPQCVGGG